MEIHTCYFFSSREQFYREDRETDFVEVLESVAYAVCGDEDIDFESFRTIFYTKNVSH